MFTWFTNLFRGKTVTDLDDYNKASIATLDGYGTRGAKARPFNYDAGVHSFWGWVYAASMTNAQAVASVPLRLYVRGERKGEKFYSVDGKRSLFRTRPVPKHRKRWLLESGTGPDRATRRKLMEWEDFEEITERHPLTDLLHDVNPYLNGFDTTTLRVLWGELTGNAYMLKLHGNGKSAPPTELWPLPPQWVWIKPSRENWIDGYIYGRQVQDQTMFEPDEVIHFRRPNPRDQFYGLGKVEAGWSAININAADHEMDQALADNHARPDYAIIIEGATGDQLDRLDSQIRQKFRGSKKAGQFLSLSGAKAMIQPLNFTPKDLTGRSDTVEEIAAVFGVPVSMLRANDPNLASAKQGYASWREMTVLPLCRMDEQTLNQNLVPLFSDDLVLSYDNPVPADNEYELRRRQSAVAGGWQTINEARVEEGRDEVDDNLADVPLVNGQPLGAGFGLPAFTFNAKPTPSEPSPDTTPADAQDIQTTQETVLNGAQVQAAQSIVQAVANGELPRDSGVSMLQTFFNLTPEIAEHIMGSSGNPDVPTTPNPKPQQEQADDAGSVPADGVVADPNAKRVYIEDLTGTDGNEVISHRAYMVGGIPACDCEPVSLKHQWHTMTKADASDTARDDEQENPLQRFARKMADVFGQQRKAIVKLIGSIKAARTTRVKIGAGQFGASLGTELAKFDPELEKILREFAESVIATGGKAGLDILKDAGIQLGDDVFNVTNPKVDAFLKQYTVELRQAIQGYTEQAVTNMVRDGLAAGQTPADLAASLREDVSAAGGSLSPSRSEAIARTESARAYVEGERMAWEESEVVEGKQWLLAPSACPFCEEVARQFNNRTVSLSEPFYKVGDSITAGGQTMKLDYQDVQGPPLHPNDRCDLVPVLK